MPLLSSWVGNRGGVGNGDSHGVRQGPAVKENQGLQRLIKGVLCERGNLGGVTGFTLPGEGWRPVWLGVERGGWGDRLREAQHTGSWSSSSFPSSVQRAGQLQAELQRALLQGEALSVCLSWPGCLGPYSERKQGSWPPHLHASMSPQGPKSSVPARPDGSRTQPAAMTLLRPLTPTPFCPDPSLL